MSSFYQLRKTARWPITKLDLTLSETDVVVAPPEPISIVGFPFGTVVWKPIVLEELLKLAP